MSVSVCVHNDNDPEDISINCDFAAVLAIKELKENISVKTCTSGEAFIRDVVSSFALQLVRFVQETPDPDETIAQFNVALDDIMKEVIT